MPFPSVPRRSGGRGSRSTGSNYVTNDAVTKLIDACKTDLEKAALALVLICGVMAGGGLPGTTEEKKPHKQEAQTAEHKQHRPGSRGGTLIR